MRLPIPGREHGPAKVQGGCVFFEGANLEAFCPGNSANTGEYYLRTCLKQAKIKGFATITAANPLKRHGIPYEIRTRVTAVRGRCPRPLDERDRISFTYRSRSCRSSRKGSRGIG